MAIAYFSRRILSIACLFIVGSPALANETFIATGDALTSSSNSAHTIRIGERLPIVELKARFRNYSVRSTAGEDCEYCANIASDTVAIDVNYDQSGIIVVSVVCHNGCSDALGNAIGTKLKSAIGKEGNCEAGYFSTCMSPQITGLTYILNDIDTNCGFGDFGPATSIPDCARIAGFMINGSVSAYEPESNATQLQGQPQSKKFIAKYTFAEFAVGRVFQGANRYPDFAGRDKEFKLFRTRIREGMNEGPNLAGEYSIIQIGCGTECSIAYVANNRTGQVFPFPRGGEANLAMQIEARLESSLIITQWGSYDLNQCFVEYFIWENDTAKLLSRNAVGEREACYEDLRNHLVIK